eukprot:Colp12_sorted_trinity150504_noHs@696
MADEISAAQLAGLGGKGGPSKEEQAARQAEARQAILTQVLAQEARARLSNIILVKPDKGRAVEEMIVRMAQTGQLRKKVDEAELIKMLDQVNQVVKKDTHIKYTRRRIDDDDDDIDLADLEKDDDDDDDD